MLTGVRSFSAFCGLVLLSSCGGGGDDGTVCTADLRAGIVINVSDAITGSPANCGSHATLTTAGYSEVAPRFPQGSPCDDRIGYGAAWERPGVYTVVVSKPGYQDFTANNVIVRPGECHVTTVTLDVRLSP